MPAPEQGPTPLELRVFRALTQVIDPEIRKPITELDMVSWITVTEAGEASAEIKLTIVGCPAARTIENNVRAAIAAVPGVNTVDLVMTSMTTQERNKLTYKLRGGRSKALQFGPDNPTRIYAIKSGKGGVGNSTDTANLGVALAARGLRVGIVDADVFGFSIPGILGIEDEKPTRVNDMILPPIAFEVKVI
jgi:ATP-binding protein involved in chromosome partitioning